MERPSMKDRIMRLTKLTASGEGMALHGEDRDITGIVADSRKIEPGFLFAAIPGETHDGRKFIPEAIRRGVAAILIPEDNAVGMPPLLTSPARGEEHHRAWCDSPPLAGGVEGGSAQPGADSAIAFVTTPNIRKSISSVAAQFYPRQPETIAAVTGTSGKTSVAQFAREIWQTLGRQSASIGTLGLVTAKETRYGSLTTPDAITLHRMLDEISGNGISHLAMEASSHGLAMNRLDHVRIKAAAFTNLSHDHLDFHETMENYLETKRRLFVEVLPEGGAAVINADAPQFESLTNLARTRNQKLFGFGIKGKEIRLISAKPDVKGQVLRFDLFGISHEILLPVTGQFQAWNALCALGLVIGCGENANRAAAALADISGVPGRLQLVGHTQSGGAIFVDYAHKPDALENVLNAVRPHVKTGAKLGVVLGCGGNRDKGKRPMMGEIADRLADWVIVADDNPRHEDPAAIRSEILAGCASGDVQEIADRAEAIAAGIARLGEGDILIIAGKGHEPGQIVGDTTLPFDDVDVAREALGLKY
jgi:UDP-N-acetylmuramoyl-L-alanyl-D-glutamate--2,6-diaminopimelate ligase